MVNTMEKPTITTPAKILHMIGNSHMDPGCYSNDLEFKRIKRLAEKRLQETDTLHSLDSALTGAWLPCIPRIETLWESLLFTQYSFAQADKDSVRIELVKKAEDDDDFIFRVWETEGMDTLATLTCLGVDYPIELPAHAVETFKLNVHQRHVVRVDLLEWTPEII